MSTVATELAISLELGCVFPECQDFSAPLYWQLVKGNYDSCSVMAIPSSVESWRLEHRTARKRADRCRRRGFVFVDVVRHERAAEICAINVSMGERQGRPMGEGYYAWPSETPDPTYACWRHGIHPYGVEAPDGKLVAYLWIYRAGELALVSQILGHGRYLVDEVMYPLWQGMLERERDYGDGFVVYNRHDSGTDGLRFYKERVGLSGQEVRWWP